MNSRPIRLLHVDDDAEFAEMVALFLQREHEAFVVETVNDVSAALDRLETGSFDCIISDYEMPGQTGLDLLRAVRDTDEKLPFVLFTGRGSEEIAAEAISAGVSDYLQKAGGTEQYTVLANRVENLVGRYRSERDLHQRIDAIETAREGIALVDSEGTVTYTNRAFANALGYSDEEMLTVDVAALFDDGSFEETIRPAVVGRDDNGDDEGDGDDGADGEFTGEVLMRRCDGTRLLADVAVSSTAGNQFVCTMREVAADEHRDHELFLKNRAMDAAPIGITITDPTLPDNPTIYANDQFERLTGYTEAAMLGENHRILQGRETDPEAVATLRAAIDAEDPVTVELRNYRKDGTSFWNRVSVAPIHDEDGTVTNFVGFQQDVTELVHARREREAVLDRVSDAFFALDREWQFTYLNDQAERLLGRTREDLIGRSVWEVFPEAVDSTFFKEYKRAIETQETVAFEEYYPPLSTWFEVRAYPSESGLSVYFRDVSSRKANERQLEQRTRQFETFGDVLAHDIRSPLATLEGRLELARKTGEAEQLTAAQEAFERVETLIDDLATVMREGSVVNEERVVDLASVARETWAGIDTSGATLDVAEGRIRADRNALARLLQNLFRNSVEHGSTGSRPQAGDSVEHGHATVAVSLGLLDDGSGFFVADDGPGIPESERERVFEPGYSSKSGGGGFGLVSITQIVLAHGWDISVTESERGGARFEIRNVEVADDTTDE